jgi:hypothetical protein
VSVSNEANRFAIVAGGFSHENTLSAPLESVKKYNVATNKLTSLGDLIKPPFRRNQCTSNK